MVKARENALHANLKNVEIMLGDGRNLCFRNGSIDIILAGTQKINFNKTLYSYLIRLAMGTSREFVLSNPRIVSQVYEGHVASTQAPWKGIYCEPGP